MIAIDTNVLLRYVLRDDTAQTKKATQLIEDTIADGENLFIHRLVLCEAAWVLQQSYRLPKSDILAIIGTLLAIEGFIIDAEEEMREAIEIYRNHNLGFSDAFIAVGCRNAGASHTATFDKKAAALPEFKLPK